ncbi:hypothetical protein KKC13_03840 [bacterium]|jgi:hypothetical protein|nr:hypothetical protein [bacterium]MBU1957352.1 hypothetical protein [bacterium]
MKTTHLLIATLTAISFTACGGDNHVEGFDGNSYEEIAIDVACTSPDTPEGYITLKSADQIIKDEEGSNITILHDENGVKKVCISSGKAHINRANVE